jgi:predicted RNA binding protein YcfA (HicA-like mRNA interferase family)
VSARILRGVSRDVAAEALAAAERGWAIGRTKGGHVRMTHPRAGIVVTCGTAGDRRAVLHFRAELRRAERGTSGTA